MRTTMSSDKTTNNLIMAVKSRPCIYNPTHYFHKNKKEIDKCWTEIVAELNEKKQKITQLKRRWRGLKSCYIKYKKANNSTRESLYYNQYKDYDLGPQLDFLEPHVYYQADSEESDSTEREFAHKPMIETQETPITQTDDITYLFLSYAKTFRKLTPKVKISLKLELANLFLKAEWEQIQNREYTIPLKMETHFSDDD